MAGSDDDPTSAIGPPPDGGSPTATSAAPSATPTGGDVQDLGDRGTLEVLRRLDREERAAGLGPW